MEGREPSEGFLDRIAKELLISRASLEVLSLNTDHGPCTVILARVGEESASQLSAREGILVPPHVNVISVGWAATLGTEAVTRIPEGEDANEEALMVEGTASFFALAALCQASGHKFRGNESAQYRGWTFDVRQSGPPGALLVTDPLLKGFGAVDEHNGFVETGENADSDGWPAHFLCIYPLLPREWATAPGVRTTNYIRLVRELWSPVFLATPRRCEHSAIPGFAQRVQELKAIVPAHYMADNADMDVQLRHDGRALDIIVSSDSLINLVTPFEEVFDRDLVPAGCRVGMESIGYFYMVKFYARLDKGEGDEVTPEQAHFRLERCLFSKNDPDSDVEVPTSEAEKCMLANLSLEELVCMGLIRRMEFSIYAPKEFMGSFMASMREISVNRRPPGHGRRGASPSGSIIELPGYFHGTLPPGGLLGGYPPAQSQRFFPKCTVRILAVPADYQLRHYRMDDAGNLRPSLESLGLVPHKIQVETEGKEYGTVTGYFLPDGMEMKMVPQ